MSVTEINTELEPEVLTDKTPTKTLPCRRCGRACTVTLFMSAGKVECSQCRGASQAEHQEKVQIKQAHTVDPATLENLADALINPVFRTVPLCPFDPEHHVELKSVTHSPNYGPRHLLGYNSKGAATYDQQTGESVLYQCNDCRCTISYSTQHQALLRAQNEARAVVTERDTLVDLMGTRPETPV